MNEDYLDKFNKSRNPKQKLTDFSLMPVGTYRGLPMDSVPAFYLLRIFDQNYEWVPGNVRDYIETNYDVLKKETKKY